MSITFNLYNCPFCQTELINSTVHCTGNKKYSCLECLNCNSFFYTKNIYKILYNLAEKENRKLSPKVYYYDPEISIWKRTSVSKSDNIKKTNNNPELFMIIQLAAAKAA